MVADSSPTTLVLKRQYSKPPQTVFDVWTSPEQMRKWFMPQPGFTHPFIEMDLQVGGAYRIAFGSPAGDRNIVSGRFLEIDEPRKLVYTWTWEEPNPNHGIETLVTVEFNAVDDGTELVLTHERFPAGEMREHHKMGWTGILDQLVEYLK